MRSRHEPLKWPFAIGLALLLLFGGIFLIPAHWINLFFSPLDLSDELDSQRPVQWMTILPPLEIEPSPEIVPEPENPPKIPPVPRQDDPRWWTRGWQVRTDNQVQTFFAPATVGSDHLYPLIMVPD